MAPAQMINFGRATPRFLLRQLPLPELGKLQQVLQLGPHLDHLGADSGELILDVAALKVA